MIKNYAQYTVVLRSLMENPQTKTELEKALSTYPLYNGKKEYDLIPTRKALNEKILNHYKYREIGFETVGRFLDELKITMCEIMPYYNELFKSVEIMANLENPFDNVDVTETFEETRTENTSSEGSTTSESNATGSQTTTGTQTSESNATHTESTNANGTKETEANHRVSDTPQNSVNNIDNYLTEHVVDNAEEQTTNTVKVTSTDSNDSETTDNTTTQNTNSADGSTSSEGSTEMTGTTRHTFTKKGNQGVNTYAHDMNEFRTSIIDVVDRIIHDNRIAELFMLVW